MILRTRNERVLYRALEIMAKAANAELAALMVDSAIVQADEQTPHLHIDRYIGFSYNVAHVKGQPMPEDL